MTRVAVAKIQGHDSAACINSQSPSMSWYKSFKLPCAGKLLLYSCLTALCSSLRPHTHTGSEHYHSVKCSVSAAAELGHQAELRSQRG